MFLRRRKPLITRDESLRSVCLRNTNIKAERQENGELLITIERGKAWWVNVISKVFYVPTHRQFVLDELGASVWDMCDGKTPVRAMIGKFASKYKLNRREAEVSVVEYLKRLARKRLIGIAVPRKPEKAGSRAKHNRGAKSRPT